MRGIKIIGVKCDSTGKGKFIIVCEYCETEVIVTKFSDGVIRYLCPKCHKGHLDLGVYRGVNNDQ